MPILLACALTLVVGTATAQIDNPSFELNTAGVPFGWTNGGGGTSVSAFADGNMPTAGSRYVAISANGLPGAIPHSNPGGFGTDATGTARLFQDFTVPTGSQTTLTFSTQLLVGATSPDFLEVSIVGPAGVRNVLHLDASNTPGGAGTIIPNLQTTALTTISVNLGAIFPTANANTVFRVNLHVGNVSNSVPPSFGRFDNFLFSAGTPFAANSLAFSVLNPTTVRLAVQSISPFTRFFNLISLDVSGPVNGGPALGLYLDSTVLLILTLPLGTTGLHDLTGPTGAKILNIPAFINPSGLTFDYTGVFLTPLGAVESFTTPVRFMWP